MKTVVCFSFYFLYAVCAPLSAAWQSKIVYPDTTGMLVYVADSNGNKIPDFSWAGYKNGVASIPDVPVVKTVGPVSGDNTQSIQSAIDYVAGLPPDSRGLRGAVLLGPGMYRVNAPVKINASGIVLRGSGEGPDSSANTILLSTGDSSEQYVIVAGGGNATEWADSVSGTTENITSDSVMCGDRTFQVADAAPLSVGDNIIIYHPCTQQWLQAINFGGTDTAPAWTVGSMPVFFNRYVVAKSGNALTIDAPVFNSLIKSQSQCYVYKYARAGMLTNIGIEKLRIDIFTTDSTTDRAGTENHSVDAIDFMQVEDAWARHCTVMHFTESGFKMTTATRVTVDSCTALDPISIMDGTRRYNFNLYKAAQLILYSNNYSNNARHDFVSNGASAVSGNVFYNCISDSAYDLSEGHRHWSQGLLWDNITFIHSQRTYVLGAYNRGSSGTSHGWAAVNSVLWNCDGGTSDKGVQRTILVQQPPTAQNYAIGCMGIVTGAFPPAPFNQPQGYIEGSNTAGLTPKSLYLAQRAGRLGTPAGIRYAIAGNAMRSGMQPRLTQWGRTIELMIPVQQKNSLKARSVAVKIFNALGREALVLSNAHMQPGMYRVPLDAVRYGAGVYWCRLHVDDLSLVKKIVLTK